MKLAATPIADPRAHVSGAEGPARQARSAARGDDADALRQAAHEFESLLVHQMMKAMRKTVPTEGGLTGDSFAHGVYTDMLDERYAGVVGEQGGLGLADMIVAQLGGPAAQGPMTMAPRPLAPVVGRASTAPLATRGALAPATDAAHTHRGLEMKLPTEGRLSSHYGPRSLGGGPRRVHKGLDIAAPQGREIGAALPGKVAFAGELNGYGNVVYLDHGDGLTTRYAHASKLNVRAGDEVRRGQIIAEVGSTGRSTGPHLHFEVRRNGRAEDPLPWLGLTRASKLVRHAHEHGPEGAHHHQEGTEEARTGVNAEHGNSAPFRAP